MTEPLRQPIMVNLWGSPGSGKSRTCAMVFNILKAQGVRCEASWELAKDLTYDRSLRVLEDSFYLAAAQERRNNRLIGHVDIIVTDSPPGLTMAYAKEGDREILRDLCLHWRLRYSNLDYLVIRPAHVPYETSGRNQTEEESRALQHVIQRELARFTGNLYDVDEATTSTAHTIALRAIGRLKRAKRN